MSATSMTIRTAVLGTAVAAVAALGVVPAQAATGYDRCPSNRMCVFTGTNGTGAIGIFANGDGDLADSTGPRGLNNNIESVWNRRGSHWALWNDKGYGGNHTLVAPRAKGNIPVAYRNIASSLKDVRL